MSERQERQGGCACGGVRYRLASAPYDAGWCHCRICRGVSGAPALVFATVPLADYIVTQGEELVGEYHSSPIGKRRFCTRCGTPLTMHVEHQPDEIDFTVATLDDPDGVAPGFHIFFGEKVAWFDTADTLPRHEKLRPDTRGLPEGQVEP